MLNQVKLPSPQNKIPTWPAALIDPAIELSYGNLVERKRLPLSTKPNSNGNPEIQELKIDPL